MTLLAQLLLNALCNAATYSLLAIGFGLFYRSLRFFNIGFGAVYVVTSYAVITASQALGLPLFVSIPSGLIFAGLVSVLMDKLIFHPLDKHGSSSGVLLVASLGIYIAIINLIALIFGNEIKILSKGMEPSYSLGSLIITRIQIIQILVGWLTTILFWLAIRKNTLIKAIWAMGKVPELIRALGLPYNQMRAIVFFLSALFAGLASIATSFDVGFDPHVGMGALLTGAVAVIVGGVDIYWGWICGASLIAFLQAIGVWLFSAKWNELITFALLIITLLFRPHGIFSQKRRAEEK